MCMRKFKAKNGKNGPFGLTFLELKSECGADKSRVCYYYIM